MFLIVTMKDNQKTFMANIKPILQKTFLANINSLFYRRPSWLR